MPRRNENMGRYIVYEDIWTPSYEAIGSWEVSTRHYRVALVGGTDPG